MNKYTRSAALWALYFAFATYALWANWHSAMFEFSGSLGGVKLIVWLVLAGFLAYSIYCTLNENLFRSIGTISTMHWGRQIGIDLYLGLLVSLFIVYLHDGALVALIWLLPTLAFANLSILLYLAINFDSLAARFIG